MSLRVIINRTLGKTMMIVQQKGKNSSNNA